MREILFRAKAVNRKEGHEYRTDYKNGDWVYGLLANNNPYLDFAEMTNTDGISGIEVDKNTIGQYTGLTDKNGKKIFEGDIVSISGELKGTYTCVWEEYNFEYEFDNKTMSFGLACVDSDDIEVIGNIHDNQELIGDDNNG